MKKKILLLSVAVMVLTIALAICVGATTIYRDGDGLELFRFEMNESNVITTYQGEFPKTDSEGNALTWYVTATTTEGENTIKTVASVLTLDENHSTLADGVYSYKGSTVKNTNVVSAYFPSDKGITKLNLANGGYRLSNTYSYKPDTTEILFVYLPSTLTELPERIVQGSKAIVCHIPMEATFTEISHVSFHEAKCLREINVPPTVTEIEGIDDRSGAAFYKCESLTRVTVGEGSVLTTIGDNAFNGCVNLSYINIPDSVTKVGGWAFYKTALVESPFGMGSTCKEIGARAFSEIEELRTFIVPATLTKAGIAGNGLDYGPLALSENIELVVFGNAATVTELMPSFFARAGVKKLVLPNGPTSIPSRYFVSAKLTDVCLSDTIKTIGEFAFESATVEVIRLGANFEYFTNNSGVNQRMTNAVNGLKAVYIPASFYAKKPETVQQVAYALNVGGSSSVDFFYTGTKAQLEQAIINFKEGTTEATLGNSYFLNAKQISYNEYCLDPAAYGNGNYIIYDYDPCQAFCEPFVEEGTVREGTIVYESYLEKGVKSTACPICGELAKGIEVAPIFVCYGYSVPESGQGGITIFYTIDKVALEDYTRITGKSITYGVFAASYEKLGENDAVNAKGEFANGVIGTEIKNKDNAGFEIKVVGFTTDAQKKAKLVVSAYTVVTKGEETVVSYLQPEAPTEGSRYNLIAFDDYNPTI